MNVNRRNENTPLWVLVLIVVVCFGAVFAVAATAQAIGCHMRWASSGKEVNYIPFAGCQVKQADGTWIPERALRVVP